jgi:hypothetical protein
MGRSRTARFTAGAVVMSALVAGACARTDDQPTAPGMATQAWNWPDRSIAFTLGGGRRQPRTGFIDRNGDLVHATGRRAALDPHARAAADRWLRDPDALGRRAAELNCDAGFDAEFVAIKLKTPSTLPQPFTFCTEDLAKFPDGAQLLKIVESLR